MNNNLNVEYDYTYDCKTMMKLVKKAYFESLKTYRPYSRVFVFESDNGMFLKYEDNLSVELEEYYKLQEYLLADFEKSMMNENGSHEAWLHNKQIQNNYYDLVHNKLFNELDDICNDILKTYKKKRDTEPLFNKLVIKTFECALYDHLLAAFINNR